MRREEQDIQRSVFEHVAWRRVPNLFAFHPANGGWRSPIEARIMKGLGVVPGVPDVILIRNRVYGLELKAEGGRLSPAQLQTHEQMRAAGATVEVATGIDEAIEQLKTWGLLRS